VSLVALGGLCLAPTPSVAEDDEPPALTCVVRGETVVPPDVALYDLGSGGSAIAKLTGAKTPLELSSFPEKLATGRVKVATTKASGYVRIEGFAALSSFRFFASRDLPVDGTGGVWITKGQQVTLAGANGSGFTVKKEVFGSDGQEVTAAIGCDGVALELQSVDATEVPARARHYQMKNATLDLFDEPGGTATFTLSMTNETRKYFWSTESKSGFTRVMSRGDLTIDAWARTRDLKPLAHAEISGLDDVTPLPLKEHTLALENAPKVLVADAELPIHGKPQNAVKGIGVVEVGARFYAMRKSGDWTAILPESLAVMPPDDGGFWVRTSGLPKP
jgi:hypothetical protein